MWTPIGEASIRFAARRSDSRSARSATTRSVMSSSVVTTASTSPEALEIGAALMDRMRAPPVGGLDGVRTPQTACRVFITRLKGRSSLGEGPPVEVGDPPLRRVVGALRGLVAVHAQDPLGRRVAEGDLALAVEHGDRHRARLRDPEQEVVLLAQGLLRRLALGDVQGREGDADRQVRRIEGRRREQHVEDRAVLPPEARLDAARAPLGDLPVLLPADELEVLVRRVEDARALADQLARGVAHHLAETVVDLDQPAVDDDADPRRARP